MRARVLLLRSALLAAGAASAGLTWPGGRAEGAGGPPGARTADDVLSLNSLHGVQLFIDPAHFPTLDGDRSVRVPCDVMIDGATYAGARIKQKGSHGSSSSMAGKPGFTITFGAARPAGLRKLTLNNARQDPTFLHEHLAYKLYRLAGLPAPRTTHAVVSVNETSYGVFVMVESVHKAFLERSFGPGHGEGNLYEGTGNEFLEGAANHGFLELKDEEQGRTREDIAALALAAGVPDDLFEASISRRLDLDRFITAFALDCLLAHWDGPMFRNKNFYLYHNPADDRFHLIPHGMDLVFDVDYDFLQTPRSQVARRIRSVPALDARLRAETNRLMETVWDVPVLLDRMARVAGHLHQVSRPSGAVRRDLGQFDLSYGALSRQVTDRRRRWRPL